MADFDFSADADSTIGKIQGLAKKAFSRMNMAYAGAAALHKLDADESAAKQEKEEKQEQEAAKKKTKLAASVGAVGIIANLLLDRNDPILTDLASLSDFDADDLSSFISTLDEVYDRFEAAPKLMRKALKSSDFLNASEKTDPKISELLADIDDGKLNQLAAHMLQNTGGQLDLWKMLIMSRNLTNFERKYIDVLKKISRINERKNQAGTGAGGTVTLYTGSKIVELLRGELQLLERRIGTLRDLVHEHAFDSASSVQEYAARVYGSIKLMELSKKAAANLI